MTYTEKTTTRFIVRIYFGLNKFQNSHKCILTWTQHQTHKKCHLICNVSVLNTATLFYCMWSSKNLIFLISFNDRFRQHWLCKSYNWSYHYRKYFVILCYTLYHILCCFVSCPGYFNFFLLNIQQWSELWNYENVYIFGIKFFKYF